MSEHNIHSDHPHQHGDDCGHRCVQHGNHVDYDHDGHRHMIHQGHVDECRLGMGEVDQPTQD